MQLFWFLVLISVLITVHEVGHYVVARMCDIKVQRLSLGFGPKLLRLVYGETEFVLAAIPLGGYVKLLGGDPLEPVPEEDRERAYAWKPLWQRVLVLLAGPCANLALAGGVYFHFYAGEKTLLSSTVGTVFEGQPASEVLQPGDRIVAIDDQPVRYWEEVNQRVQSAPGRDLRITVERPGQPRPLTKVLTPRAYERRDLLGAPARVGLIGVAPHYHLAQIGVVTTVSTGATGAREPSPAARAGLRTFDVITSVQGRPVETWADLERVLATNRGEPLLVTYLRRESAPLGFTSVARLDPGSAQVFPIRCSDGKTVRYDTGIRPGGLYIDRVEPDTPAARAGLRPGDAIVSIDGTPLGYWEMLEQHFASLRERPFTLVWRTPEGEEQSAPLQLELRRARDEFYTESTLYVFGAAPRRAIRPVLSVPIDGQLGWALRHAAQTTFGTTHTMLRILSQLLVGNLPVSAVGGPLMMYQMASVVASRGSDEFLVALAVVSLNIGILNLLPVPLLDGGQLLVMLIEAVRRRPLGRRARERSTYVGMLLLGALILMALHNDVMRLWFR